MSTETSAPPSALQIVHLVASRTLLKYNGRELRVETPGLIEWLGSRRWYMVNNPAAAAATWNDLSQTTLGRTSEMASVSLADLVVELTTGVLGELHYQGIFEKTVEAFIVGQTALASTAAIHENLRQKLPGADNTLPAASHRFIDKSAGVSPMSALLQREDRKINHNFAELIASEPWIMVCTLLIRSGFLQYLDTLVPGVARGNKPAGTA